MIDVEISWRGVSEEGIGKDMIVQYRIAAETSGSFSVHV
jgi:hypothetical protein